MPERRELLERLRRLRGIAPGFHDYRGDWHELGTASLCRLLASFGHEVEDEATLERDLQALSERDWVRVLPPVVVRRNHEPVPFTVLAPLLRTVRWRVETESGDTHFGEVRPDGLPVLAERGINELWYVRLALDLPALPAGYHRLWLEKEDGGVLGNTRLVAVPERCHQPEFLQRGERAWGVAIQLYTLRSARNWGIGDFTDLAGFGAAVAALGADFVGINPLHALSPADPGACAPYSPSSRDYLNVLYIDPEAIEDFQDCPEARRLVALPEFQARLSALRAAPLVDYAGVTACKLEVLRAVFDAFEDRAGRARRLAFHHFLQREGESLERFALFHALQAHFTAAGHRGGWSQWPAPYGDPDGSAAQAFRDAEGAEIRFHCWLQWIARSQLDAAEARLREAGLRLGLYRDLAVGPAAASAETWGRDAPYARGVSVGAPPDSLAPQGQDWGIPPFAPDALRESGYDPFIRLLRANMGAGGALRLDHVMALMRLWWVPRGGRSDEGGYVHYPFDDLMGIVALESRRQQCLVIGEDLGTVPPEVRDSMARHGVYGYRVLLFEREPDGAFKPAEAYPRDALVTAVTHDLAPLPGIWRGTDIDLRERLGLCASTADPASERDERDAMRTALAELLRESGLIAGGAGGAEPRRRPSLRLPSTSWRARRVLCWHCSRRTGSAWPSRSISPVPTNTTPTGAASWWRSGRSCCRGRRSGSCSSAWRCSASAVATRRLVEWAFLTLNIRSNIEVIVLNIDSPTRSASGDVPPEALLPALEEGATVVTATRRLARAIQSRYARERGDGSWATPDVLPWAAWLQARFRQLRDAGQLGQPRALLDEWQSAALWERLLSADAETGRLLMPGPASDGFHEAWRLLREWRLPESALQARAGEDARVFLRLAATFERELEALEAVDAAQLGEWLAPALSGEPGPPVLFAGFDQFTPTQQALLDALGPRARRVTEPHIGGKAGVAAFADTRSELAAAAAWARQRLDADPAARIGIVVPDLDAHAGLLEDLLDEALCPERLWPGRADAPRPWNVSLGRALADAPAVGVALLALQLHAGPLETLQAGRLLRSPFLGGGGVEAERRARLDAWMRERAGAQVRSGQLLGWLRMPAGPLACPELATRLAGFLDALREGARRRRPSAWAAALAQALRRLGWPGDGPQDSATWQTAEAWAELLDAFARLDGVAGLLDYPAALGRLRRMAGARRFQPETPDVPIQVLGLLETAGLEFDALWISGLHDGVLPAPLRPNPLLPASLQRELGMPRACPETELQSARRLVARLAAAAPEACFSYPLVQDDEPLRPSPVISHLPALEALPEGRRGVASGCFAARALVAIDDSRAPAVTGQVSGGTGLLTSQSSCPFQAFAVHRLRARPLEAPAAGVDPMSRGSFLHEALSQLWRALRSQAGLRALDAAAREREVRAAAEQAVGELPAELPGGLVTIELEEATRRIGELLELELARSDFEVIGSEESVTVSLGPLQIRGQVDRIDRVAGGVVIIDYKTGSPSASRWDGERPAEPQLPAYALAFRDQVIGLAFASLKPGAVGFSGRARDAEAFGPVLSPRALLGEDGWNESLSAWATALETLAQAFAEGDARVDPIQPARAGGSCSWCHLSTLCRRDELLRAGAIGDD